MLAAFLTVCLWSCSAIASARTARWLGAVAANRWRMVLAGGVLGGLWLVCGGDPGPAVWWFLLSGVIGLGLGDLCMFAAYERQGARLTSLMTHCLAVPVAVAVEWVWLGHGLGWLELGLCLAIPAVVAVALSPGVHLVADPAARRWGIWFGIGAGIGYGLGGVIARKGYAVAAAAGQPLDGFGGAATAGFVRTLGGIAFVFLLQRFAVRMLRVGHGPGTGHERSWRRGLPWLLFTASVGPGIGMVTYQWALAQGQAGPVHAVLCLSPIMVMPLAWLIDGDRPTPLAIVAGVLAAAGAAGVALLHHG